MPTICQKLTRLKYRNPPGRWPWRARQLAGWLCRRGRARSSKRLKHPASTRTRSRRGSARCSSHRCHRATQSVYTHSRSALWSTAARSTAFSAAISAAKADPEGGAFDWVRCVTRVGRMASWAFLSFRGSIIPACFRRWRSRRRRRKRQSMGRLVVFSRDKPQLDTR